MWQCKPRLVKNPFHSRSYYSIPLPFLTDTLLHCNLNRPLVSRTLFAKDVNKMPRGLKVSCLLHWIWYLVSPIKVVLFNTTCEPQYNVTNTNVNPTLCIISCQKKMGGAVIDLLSLTKISFIQISIIHDNIPWQVVDKRRHGLDPWMNSSIIHDSSCKLTRKKWHLESYHSGIEYHMTLNIIFVVVANIILFVNIRSFFFSWHFFTLWHLV